MAYGVGSAHKIKDTEEYQSLSELRFPRDEAGDEYHASFVGIIVTVRKFGRYSRQIRVFDGTENECFLPQENVGVRVTKDSDEVPPDHLLRITVYDEVWDKFITSMVEQRHWYDFNTEHYNHLNKGLFVRVSCRVKVYRNVIDPVISSKDLRSGLTLLDSFFGKSVYDRTPAMKRILCWLPKDYLALHRKNFENAVPWTVINDILDPKPVSIPATTLPIHDTRLPTKTESSHISNFLSSQMPQSSSPIPPTNQIPSDLASSPVRRSTIPESTPFPGSESPRAKRQKRDTLQSAVPPGGEQLECPVITTSSGEETKSIRELNDIEDFDDMTFAVHAIITNIEPGARQLITKSSQCANIHMNWLKIELQDKFARGEPVCENDCLRVVMNTSQEVMKFLGIEELEYGYVTSNELEKRMENVLKKAKKRVFHVKRRRIKVHKHGVYLIAWELVGVTLADLEMND